MGLQTDSIPGMSRESRCALVVGSGISGIASALELARAGVDVYLIEKEAAIGGHSASFCCKATDICVRCSACVVSDKIREAAVHPRITVITSSTLRSVSGEAGAFRVQVAQEPRYVREDRCTGCGLCTEVCPAHPKAIYPPHSEATPLCYVLDEGLCLRLKGERCDMCLEACPTKAIDFNIEPEHRELEAGAIILATGFDVYDAGKKGSLGYGRYPNVVSGLDLEQMLNREGSLTLPADGTKPRRVAFVQCVGSRDEGHGYCSHVCCKYAMKLAGLIRHQSPDAQVTIFYIDLQTAGKGFARFYDEYRENVSFIRGVPVEILQDAAGGLEVKFEDISQGKVCRDIFDLVVLSVGMSPRKNAWHLAKILGVDLSQDGFFDAEGGFGSNETNVDGVLIAGACQGPKDIPDSIAHGIAAASRAIQVLRDSAGLRIAGQRGH